MATRPSKAVETIVGWLIPPASREHVLGDLHERYLSPRQYLFDVLSVVPLVILSNIRRSLDPVVLLMEAFTFFVPFVIAAWSLGSTTFLSGNYGFFKLALPTAVAVLVLVLADAYAGPHTRSPLKPVLGAVIAVACAFLSQALLARNANLALPPAIMIAGSTGALLLVATLRILFPPPADRPRGANGPAFWHRTELVPLRLPRHANKAIEYLAWAVVVAVILLLAFHT